jgi:hypothetical protein
MSARPAKPPRTNVFAARRYVERLVERDQFVPASGRDIRDFVQIDARHSTATLGRCPLPRAIHQNAPHFLGRYGEKMGPVPVHLGDVDQTQVGFVNQGRGLESTAGAFVLHAVARDAAEFGVNPRRELLQGGPIPLRPSA